MLVQRRKFLILSSSRKHLLYYPELEQLLTSCTNSTSWCAIAPANSKCGLSSFRREGCGSGLNLALHKVGGQMRSNGWLLANQAASLSYRSYSKYLKSGMSSLIAWVTQILPVRVSV